MARLPYPEPASVAAAMQPFPERLQHKNIGRMLSHAPTALAPYYACYNVVLDQLELDPKLRQLAILRVVQRTQAHYAWVQHGALAHLLGVSDAHIAALQQEAGAAEPFTAKEQMVLAFVDAVLHTPRLSDPLFEQMRRLFSPREIVELLLIIGWYWTAGRLMTTLDLEPDPALGTQALEMLRNTRSQSAT
jgi:4-carboxymuconolactone decarboxylase